MADNVTHGVLTRIGSSPDEDEALAMVDQAIDTMIAAAGIIDANLPKIKTENVPQEAGVDAAKDLMETAINPYLSDLVQAMGVFGE